LEEFRNRLDIPIGVADVDMAEVSCELWQFPPHIETGPIPQEHQSLKKRLKATSFMTASRASSKTRGLFSLVAARAMGFIIGEERRMANACGIV
jgi:hypothetical protein